MEHLAEKMLVSYINLEIDARQQELIEDHLGYCEHCLEAYLNLMDAHSYDLNVSDHFVDNTLKEIDIKHAFHMKENQNSYQQQAKRTMTHYMLAAGLTIVLMMTGAFQSFINITDLSDMEHKPSITDQLMKQTNNIMDYIKGDNSQ
ncbi:hypothetical protein [Aquibacillus kalidii]|uniref:hypothetical protein n=1 Tax=Aquibacillus kalidii TaxID=2762597 RepID=UPI001646E664|nr:hypothetical protein [Aquibacillus kalidii]